MKGDESVAVHRIDGQEQPHIKAGIFKYAFPFIIFGGSGRSDPGFF
jgi:hypothetical protein